MLEFKRLEFESIDETRPYFAGCGYKSCIYTIGTIYMWRDVFSTEYAILDGTLILRQTQNVRNVRFSEDGVIFSVPFGRNVQGAIETLAEHRGRDGLPLVFFGVTESEMPILESFFGKTSAYTEDGWAEYVYNAADMAGLTGRKYHSKRNKITRFKAEYPDWAFEDIGGGNVGDVIDFFDRLEAKADGSHFYHDERRGAMDVLRRWDSYGLIGGLLRVGGAVAAFSVGEICGDTLVTHIEKGDKNFQGAHQVMNNEFAKRFASGKVLYVNREEDMGEDGLRRAKRSYYPVLMLKRWIVWCK